MTLHITPREAELIEAMIKHGPRKTACKLIGMALKTADDIISKCKQRNGFLSTWQLAVAYDREHRVSTNTPQPTQDPQ